MKVFFVVGLGMIFSSIAVCTENPNHDWAYDAGRLTTAATLGAIPASRISGAAFGVAGEVTGVNQAVGNLTQVTSDKAWDMMQFYRDHNMEDEMFDHDMQMRHAGCEVQ